MTYEHFIVISVILMALILFITEVLSVDVVAILIMVVLVFSGIISPEDGVAGFSNSAPVTVGAMFVLSAALFKSGAVDAVGPAMTRIIRRNFKGGMFIFMVGIAAISAFVNNTPLVAVFIPVMLKVASDTKISPSKLMMPLSFATILGGTCTLLGTSTNIVVSGIVEKSGLEPFSMFLFTPLGVCYAVIGIIFLTIVGMDMIPARGGDKDLDQKFGMRDYLSEIVLLPESPSIGKKIMDTDFVRELEMEIIEIRRNSETFSLPPLDMVLLPNDTLKVRCNIDKLKALKDKIKVRLQHQIKIGEENFKNYNTVIVELIVSPYSEFEGKTLDELDFKRRFRAVPLAIRQREDLLNDNINQTQLKVGDILLVEVKKHRLDDFRRQEYSPENPFIVLSEEHIPHYPRKKMAIILAVIFGVFVTASIDLFPIMMSSIAGCLILILTKCITPQEVYESIEWKVIFLIVGSMTLGVAMQKSGVDKLIADLLTQNLGGWGPIAIVSGLYLTSSLITEIMSNNAAAALLTPIAIATAQTMGLSYLPFVIAITFGASASFMTPIGYQTNTMIYSVGQYKFMDFVRIGVWLNLLFWIVATILIPIFFPFK
jgi:di/tricarboxylate transporter